MTHLEFEAECAYRCIDSDIALENQKIERALRERNDNEVLKLLDEEF